MRIAFVTPRFVTEGNTGLSSYLNRITRALHVQGHRVEVFVSSRYPPGVIDHHGIKVHRIRAVPRSLFFSMLRRVSALASLYSFLRIVYQSWCLSRALEARDRTEPFDVVQYSDYLAVGLCMKKKRSRKNIVRVSISYSLFQKANGKVGLKHRINELLELYSIRRADWCYAPSRFVASFFKDTYSMEVDVIRPPCSERYRMPPRRFAGLPQKYFIHFGQLCRGKGTYWLIDSLRIAFKVEPSIRIVLVGWDYQKCLEDRLASLGEFKNNVLVFSPLPQSELFDILSGATAAILPSLVDNLPNTVIESLQHGIPVIGSKGASIDEIVEEGVTGELAEIDNNEQLSNLIVKFWQGRTLVRRGFNWSGLRDVLSEEASLQRLLQPAVRA